MHFRRLVLLPVLLIVSIATGMARDFTQVDLKLGGEYLFPRDSDFDQAYGGGARLTFWGEADIGLTFALSGQRWDLQRNLDPPGIDEREGDFTLIPAGMSLAVRSRENEDVQLVLEAGARYTFADSNIDGREYGDGMTGVLQADLEISIGLGIALYLGGGYQFDLSKGDVTVADKTKRDYSQAAWFIGGGLVIVF